MVGPNIKNDFAVGFMLGDEYELRTDLAASIACSKNEQYQVCSFEGVWDMIKGDGSGLRGFQGCPSSASWISSRIAGQTALWMSDRFGHHFFNNLPSGTERISTRNCSAGIVFDLLGIQSRISGGGQEFSKIHHRSHEAILVKGEARYYQSGVRISV